MLLFTNLALSSLVSAGRACEMCVSTPLVPDTCRLQATLENVELTVNFICQPSASLTVQGDPDSHLDRRLVLLILWYACWIVIAFFLHIFVGHYLSHSRNGTRGRSHGCPYPIPMGRSRAVLSSPSMLGEDGSPFPFASVDDDNLADVASVFNERGCRSAAVGSDGVLSRSGPLADQAGTQNSLSINESDAPTTNSHGPLTSQTLSNWPPSTSLVQPGGPVTPHSGALSPNTHKRRTYLSGPVRSRSRRRAHQNVILDVFEPRLAEPIPLLATLLAWTTLPTPPASSSSVFEPRPVDSTRSTPLFAALYPRLGHLTIASRTKWFIFVIAVTCKEHGVIDPKFDLAFLRKVFGQSKSTNVRFECLAEGDATLENIRAKLESLYCEARESRCPFRLCIYLTGIGDGDSKMCLLGGEVISEQELGGWTQGLQDQSTGSRYSNSISAILDFCREAMKQRDLMDDRLGLVWSSSIGEPPSANAYSLGDGLPMSCFLIALFSVANDITTGSSAFGEAIKLQLEQIGDFLRFCYDRQHETNGRCERCKAQGEKCLLLALQVPEWDSAGLDMLTALAELIKAEYSEYALGVSEALAREMGEQGFPARINDCHLPSGLNQASSVWEARASTPHSRGANERTSQIVEHMV